MELNWLDIVIICTLIFGALDGMVKGFIVSFFNIAGIFISLLCAKYFSSVFSNFIIDTTSAYASLKNVFLKRMDNLDNITLSLIKIIHIKNMPIEDALTLIFINIACFFCIFLVCSVIINVVRDGVKIKIKKSSLKYVDKLGGIAIGFIKALVFIFLFFAILTPLVSMMPSNSEIAITLNTSKIAKYFVLYNFVIPWFEKIMNNNSQFVILSILSRY
jgi:uncharacterized membrane protein required for colicin V production